MSHPRKRKTQSQFVLDPKQLVKQSVIGCTVQPSRDDPTLDNGVALTVLVAFDEKYVRFDDIDGMGEPSYRYWKDVFLIVAWNDACLHQPALRPGDKCFALFQNVGGNFTTVYYKATIRRLPQSPGGQIVIDFLDGTTNFTNISIPTKATVATKHGDQVVPTVIRRVCAENSNPQKEALHRYRTSHKKKQRSNKTQKHAHPKPPPTKPPKTTTLRSSVALSTNTTVSIPNATESATERVQPYEGQEDDSDDDSDDDDPSDDDDDVSEEDDDYYSWCTHSSKRHSAKKRVRNSLETMGFSVDIIERAFTKHKTKHGSSYQVENMMDIIAKLQKQDARKAKQKQKNKRKLDNVCNSQPSKKRKLISANNDQSGATKLEEEVKRLQKELKEQKDNELCVICMSEKKDHILVPCGHLCVCSDCKDKYDRTHQKCPLCRKKVKKVRKVFM